MRHGSRRPRRTRSIRRTLAGLLVLPVLSLAALWGYAASISLGNASAKHAYDVQNTDTGPPVQALFGDLVQERLQTFVWLSTGRRSPRTTMDTQRKQTDAAIARFRAGVAAAGGVFDSQERRELAALLGQLGQLDRDRVAIDTGTMSPLTAFQAYNSLVDAQFQFGDTETAVNDIPIATYQQAEAGVDGGRAIDLVGREAAVVGGALASGGRMTSAEHVLFVQAVGNQRFLEQQSLAGLSTQNGAAYRRLFASPAYEAFAALEDRIAAVAPGARIPVSPVAWQSGVQSLLAAYTPAATLTLEAVNRGIAAAGRRILVQLYVVGGVGLAAVLGSGFLLLRFGRRITRELTGLLEAVRTLASERLPVLVSRLRRGDNVDVAAEAPPLDLPSRTTEVARIAQEFDTVQRTAVEAAVGQAELRKGVSNVFRSLARRNQSLLQRQLKMLDEMEHGNDDPEALAQLFRLDHLTTRMRRQAEGLIILSGAAPGRGWRQPVPAVEVLRGAIGEIEDYVRVDLAADSRDFVQGAAVADVTHLLAELIENAVLYSPPRTRVQVRASRVANGYVVEVEDRGLGIPAGTLDTLNDRLAQPPEFDLADSDQLGLFVVSRLAARHEIKISLRGSPYGGTAAIVLLPPRLVVTEADAVGEADTAPLDVAGPRELSAGIPAGRHRQRLEIGSAAAGAQPGDMWAQVPGPFENLAVETARPDAPVVPRTGTHLDLPRRTRQASLAPQLRAAPPSALQPGQDRSAEQTRALISSIQQGWRRAGQANGNGHDAGHGQDER